MKRILHVLYAASGGGVERMLLRFLTQMDRSGLQIDIALCVQQRGMLEAQFEALGCRVIHLPHRSRHPARHLRALYALLPEYDVVHSHQNENGYVTLWAARACGVPSRMLHSHYACPPESPGRRLYRLFGAAMGRAAATQWMACSEEAGEWLFGRAPVRDGRVFILPNAFPLERFAFDAAVRREMRAQLGLGDAPVLGCVARLEAQKNPGMLLDILACARKTRPETGLLLVGEGPLERELRERAQALGLTDAVVFLGARNDVPRLLSAMDAFVLPTLAEGQGIALVEAQAAGLPVLCSDVPGVRSACVTPLAHRMPLCDGAQAWADAALALAGQPRREVRDALADAGFDIGRQAARLERLYRALPGRVKTEKAKTK